jgi:integrase
MLPQEKVSELKSYDVYEDIMAFLDEFDQKSNDKRRNRTGKNSKSNTRITYEAAIREFFHIVLNKEIEHLTEDDLKTLKKRDIINYRKQLQDNGNSNSTINKKMASIKSCFRFLNGEHEVNTAILELKRLDENTVHYGIMNQTEAELFAETAYNTEREKPYLKKMLILFAIRTSFRLDEILNVKWNSFEEVDGVYKVSVRGKRNKLVTNAISAKLYNQILELKEINKKTKWDGDPEIVFQIDEKTIHFMMKRLLNKLGISPDRNLVFHSFRKVAINWELETSNGDIRKAAQQGNHSSIETTYRNYIDQTRDYTQAAGVRMEEELDLNFLNNLTIEDFREFILQGNYKLQLDIQNFAKNKGKIK